MRAVSGQRNSILKDLPPRIWETMTSTASPPLPLHAAIRVPGISSETDCGRMMPPIASAIGLQAINSGISTRRNHPVAVPKSRPLPPTRMTPSVRGILFVPTVSHAKRARSAIFSSPRRQRDETTTRYQTGGSLGEEMTAFPASFFQQPSGSQGHRPVDRLAHVVNGQAGHRDGS